MKEQRRRFCEAYLLTLNSSEAARQAGYKGRANTIGSRLLTNVDIQEYINKRLNAVIDSEKTALKKLILDELRTEAFSESTFTDETKGGIVTRANPNKLKALELLSKYLGMLTEKHEHTGKDGGPIVLKWPDDPNPAT